MSKYIKVITLTFRSLKSSAFLQLILICCLLTLGLIISLTLAVSWITSFLVDLKTEWIAFLVPFLSGTLMLIIGWMMFPILLVLIGGFFQERVIALVETEYGHPARPVDSTFGWKDFSYSLGFALKALLLQMMILPTYLLGIGWIISIWINSYLIGKEFFESVVGYFIGREKAIKLASDHRGIVYSGGTTLTLMGLLPVINLLLPLVAVIWMVHTYHVLKDSRD